jgi:hypothetical protein
MASRQEYHSRSGRPVRAAVRSEYRGETAATPLCNDTGYPAGGRLARQTRDHDRVHDQFPAPAWQISARRVEIPNRTTGRKNQEDMGHLIFPKEWHAFRRRRSHDSRKAVRQWTPRRRLPPRFNVASFRTCTCTTITDHVNQQQSPPAVLTFRGEGRGLQGGTLNRAVIFRGPGGSWFPPALLTFDILIYLIDHFLYFTHIHPLLPEAA